MRVRAQRNIFLPGSKPSAFISFYTLSSSLTIYHPILSLYSSLHFLSPFFPSSPPFFPFISLSFQFLFLFLFFLSSLLGKFEHFSYFPGSATTTLLHFLSPGKGNLGLQKQRFCFSLSFTTTSIAINPKSIIYKTEYHQNIIYMHGIILRIKIKKDSPSLLPFVYHHYHCCQSKKYHIETEYYQNIIHMHGIILSIKMKKISSLCLPPLSLLSIQKVPYTKLNITKISFMCTE